MSWVCLIQTDWFDMRKKYCDVKNKVLVTSNRLFDFLAVFLNLNSSRLVGYEEEIV